MKKKYCIANWKMNQSVEDCENYAFKLKSSFCKTSSEMIVCPSFIHLSKIKDLFGDLEIQIGAQTISEHLNGAYTGEISVEMLNDFNINWTIVGHSERRQFFNETNQDIQNKLKIAVENKINPIVCIGETLLERQNSKTIEVLKEQIQTTFDSINCSNIKLIIAYEPVWAIGSGVTADLNTISETHEEIRNILSKIISNSEKVSILYGGSVNPDNCEKILNLKHVDGFLIGGASLDPEKFLNIYRKMN